MRGSGRLDDAVDVNGFEGVFRTAGDNHPEARRLHVQPLANVLADLDLLLALMFRRNLGLDHHLDPLKMRGKSLSRTRCALLLSRAAGFVEAGLNLGDAGLDLLEHEGLLFGRGSSPQLFRPLAEPVALQRLEDRSQPGDAFVGRRVEGFEIAVFAFERLAYAAFSAMARTSAFSASTSLGSGKSSVFITMIKA